MKCLKIGSINPTTRPYKGPTISPHSNTGKCMGKKAFPSAFNCPVRSGSTSPSAINNADSVIFLFSLTYFTPRIIF